jgi:hypothetical protein
MPLLTGHPSGWLLFYVWRDFYAQKKRRFNGRMGEPSLGGHESLRKDISTDGSGSPPEGPTQDAEEDKSCQQYQKEFHDCLRKVGGIASHMLPMKP